MADTVEVFFLVDGERLEAQACLLAPTLKRHLAPDQKPVAYLREDYAGHLDSLTREVLEASGVELRVIPGTDGAHAPWTAPYPQGNKILAAAQRRDCAISVFIDTDMVLAEPVDFIAELGTADIGACVSDFSATGNDEAGWTAFYGCFGLPLPEDRVILQAGRRLRSFPYYNAGMIIFREVRDRAPTDIGRQWLDMAQQFDRDIEVPYNRDNIDQLTLPILGYQRGAPVAAMDPRLNFNIAAHGLGEGRRQSIAHYHRIGVLWSHPGHSQMTLDCLANACGAEMITRMLERFPHFMKRSRLKHYLAA
ncbi:MAG: hypothetical protein AAFY90_11965 [Pseudomonadota bacterium]